MLQAHIEKDRKVENEYFGPQNIYKQEAHWINYAAPHMDSQDSTKITGHRIKAMQNNSWARVGLRPNQGTSNISLAELQDVLDDFASHFLLSWMRVSVVVITALHLLLLYIRCLESK